MDVKITQQHDDVVQVMRTWDVEAPDWTPPFKSRPIAVRKVAAVWVNGRINRIAITGPYRLKSGALAQPKHNRDESHIGGTGDPDYRPDHHRMSYARPDADGRVVDEPYNGRTDFPEWIPAFIAEHGPVL